MPDSAPFPWKTFIVSVLLGVGIFLALFLAPSARAGLVANYTVTCDDLACRFDASPSTTDAAPITGYYWHFGNSTPAPTYEWHLAELLENQTYPNANGSLENVARRDGNVTSNLVGVNKPGPIGELRAYEFESTNARIHVTDPNADLVANFTNFTLEFWANVTSLPDTTQIIEKRRCSGAGCVNTTGGDNGENGFRFTVTTAGNAVFAVNAHSVTTGAAGFPTGSWHHWVLMANTTHLSIWRDGSEVANTPSGRLPPPTDAWLTMGDTVPSSPVGFAGYLSNVRIYNASLTSAQIMDRATGVGDPTISRSLVSPIATYTFPSNVSQVVSLTVWDSANNQNTTQQAIVPGLQPPTPVRSFERELDPVRAVAVTVSNVTLTDLGFNETLLETDLEISWVESGNDTSSGSGDIGYDVIVQGERATDRETRVAISSIEPHPRLLTWLRGDFSTIRRLDDESRFAKIVIRVSNATSNTFGRTSCEVYIQLHVLGDSANCGSQIRAVDYVGAHLSFNTSGGYDVHFRWTVSEDDSDQDAGTGLDYYLVADNPFHGLQYIGPLPTNDLDGDSVRFFNWTGENAGYVVDTKWRILAHDPDLEVYSLPSCNLEIERNRLPSNPAFVQTAESQTLSFCLADGFAPNRLEQSLLEEFDDAGIMFPILDPAQVSTEFGVSLEAVGWFLFLVVLGGGVVGGFFAGGELGAFIGGGAAFVIAPLMGLVSNWIIILAVAVALFILIDPAGMRRGGGA